MEQKKSRREKGTGSVFQKPDGSWIGRISIGKRADGKPKMKYKKCLIPLSPCLTFSLIYLGALKSIFIDVEFIVSPVLIFYYTSFSICNF